MIPNQNLFRMANERTTWKEAFKMADHVLYMGVRGVTDLMMAPGLVNLDFADIRTVMAEMGKAMMGTGEAEGENRAIRAAEAAISNPLLEDTSMAGARGLLINITGGEDMTLFEVDQAANRIREEVDEEANIIFGSAIDESLSGTDPGLGGGDRHRFAGAGGERAAAAGGGGRRRHADAAADTFAHTRRGGHCDGDAGRCGSDSGADDACASAAPGGTADVRGDGSDAGDRADDGGDADGGAAADPASGGAARSARANHGRRYAGGRCCATADGAAGRFACQSVRRSTTSCCPGRLRRHPMRHGPACSAP